MKNFLRKSLAAVGGALATGAAFADGGTTSGTTIDVSSATTSLTSMQTALTTYWSSAQPVVVSALGIALCAVLLFVGFKLVKKGANKI